MQYRRRHFKHKKTEDMQPKIRTANRIEVCNIEEGILDKKKQTKIRTANRIKVCIIEDFILDKKKIC